MSSSSGAPESWISAFCSLVGHEYFAEVSEDFIEDDFNLTGLQSQVPMYKEALEMILDVEPEDISDEEEEEEDEDDEDEDDMQNGESRGYRRQDAAERRHLRMASDLSVIESAAEMLYGMIHQRFITSRQGIQQMAEKYEYGHFGHCPRVHCHGAKVLPVGCSDIPGQETVKLFCPGCLDVYNPPNSRFQTVDGAFFGTTFGCLFFMTFPELDISGPRPNIPPPPPTAPYDQPSMSSPGRSSLSSSLTSPQVPSTSAAGTNPSQPAAPLPRQPESINGVSTKNLAPGLGAGYIYEPRIYGFRVSEVAKTGPRMKWLRSKPADINELDECYLWNKQVENAAKPKTVGDEPTELGDSEMAEPNEEIDPGEVEDQDMDAPADSLQAAGSVDAIELASDRKKAVRRKDHDSGIINGDSGGTAVRVGG